MIKFTEEEEKQFKQVVENVGGSHTKRAIYMIKLFDFLKNYTREDIEYFCKEKVIFYFCDWWKIKDFSTKRLMHCIDNHYSVFHFNNFEETKKLFEETIMNRKT